MNAPIDRDDIASRLRELFAAELAVLPDQVPDRVAELGSIERMQLAVLVEDHFRIRLGIEDEASLLSIQDLASVVEEKLRGRGAGPP